MFLHVRSSWGPGLSRKGILILCRRGERIGEGGPELSEFGMGVLDGGVLEPPDGVGLGSAVRFWGW